MRYKDKYQLVTQWETLQERTPRSVRQAVAQLVYAYHGPFAHHFYHTMMEDPHAKLFLSHAQVKQRLNPSMQRWLISIFSEEHDDLLALVEQQEKIGQVHARVDIPVNLVLGSARQLKQAFYQRIEDDLSAVGSAGRVAIYVSDTIDMAMEIMSYAYSVASERNARTEEAYKLFTLTQNIGDERERQRSALLDWENTLMYAVASQQPVQAMLPLASSEFGLWYFHKASHVFEGVPEIGSITGCIERIDHQTLPELARPEADQRQVALANIRDGIRSILMLLDDMLKRASQLEAGRDSLTLLLNRKFLSVVLGREIELARQSSKLFVLLMLDIDHFKSINDRFGHEAGDHVLQHVAGIMERSTRGGDYVFRMGGEEFLIVLVNSCAEGSRLFAERLRQAIAKESMLVGVDTLLNVTASFGLALYDGHPDYQRTIQRADEALYKAKHTGRNRVVMADTG
ncbi:diguanylate cyclase [Vreelandella sp. GE22]